MPVAMDSKYWLARAEEARALADEFRAPGAKQTLFEIAESYERLAQQAERVEKNRLSIKHPTHRRECKPSAGDG